MFWFWNNNSVDEFVFELLQEGKYEKAISIWNKILTEETISSNNFSNVKNLYTLYLALSFINKEINYNYLTKGLSIAGYFFSNGFITDFARSVDGTSSNINYENISISFIDEILQTVRQDCSNNNLETELKTITEALQLFPTQIYLHAIESFINEPVHNIKMNIAKSKKKRNEDPEEANKFGKELYDATISHLGYIENLVSNSDLKYQIIADNLAEEILQCSIDFFNKMRGSNLVDPGKGAFSLAEIALNIVQGDRAKNRISETSAVYLDWIEDRPQRDKQRKVQKSIEYIQKQLELLPDIGSLESTRKRRLSTIALNLISNCTSSLTEIRNTLGMADKLYLDYSSEVGSNALGMCIECANQTKEYVIVLNVLKKISKLDMTPELRKSLKENIEIIENNIKLGEAESIEEEKYQKISYHSNYIKTQIENLPDPELLSSYQLLNLPDITKELLEKCTESLRHIKIVAGELDEFYLNISSAVANNALGLCVTFLNRTQKINKVDILIHRIGQLDMNKKTRSNYIKNKIIFNGLKQPAKTYQADNSGFCYIATMIYGDYNSPEVIELRKFRDNVLSKYLLGRIFITVYYKYSPFVVAKFNHSQSINKIFKFFLQRLIRVVKT